MEFIYASNIDSEKPIMVINGYIGLDEDGVMGIDGGIFQRELIALDSMEKEAIEIQINSPGGCVINGYNIFSAMIMAKTKIETINVGLCASTASWLFEAGDTRTAMDYSITMVHNPFNTSGEEGKALMVFKESIVKMLSNRTGKTELEISGLMNVETWMDSIQCKEFGFCDNIRTSKNEKPVLSKTKNAFKEAFNFVNSITNNKPIIKMNYSKICNKLNIMEASNEETILNTIDSILNKYAAELTTAENSISEKETELSEVKKKLADLEVSSKEALNAKNAVFAKAMVKNYHNRISAESIESWEKKAESDLEGTEELLKSIPLNLAGKSLTPKSEAAVVETPTNAASLMAEVRFNNLKKII
jgi:ATP-dependent Clp endopeptidase proteolytic subunit ClpP